jgi:tetratricopeptide (TPR) repeat protein
MGGRTIVDSDPLLSLTLFESVLRDYKIRYIVSLVTDPGLREFEFQMIQTKKFTFTSVYRVGSLEVIEVRPSSRVQDSGHEDNHVPTQAGVFADRERQTRELFRQGVQTLEAGAADEAAKTFANLQELTRGSGYAALFRGIALEFGGHYAEALRLFDSFRYQLQAGPFIRHAWYHSMLIRELMNAEQDTSKTRKAMMYHKVSVNYWDLGFRQNAHEVLKKCLVADPRFAPAMIFGLYYSLQMGDTTKARVYFSELKRADSSHMIIRPMTRIFALMDSTRLARSAQQRREYELSLARGYMSIGLRDLTIDQTIGILEEDPKNIRALEMLAQCYDVKVRRRPAAQILERLLAEKPDYPAAREKLKELKSRF